MDKRKSRSLDCIGNGAGSGAGVDPEEEGWWEGRDRKTTTGKCTVRGDDDYGNCTPPHLESEAVAASYDSDPGILFAETHEQIVGKW